MLSKYKTFFNVIFADGKLCTHDKTSVYGHTANFIFTDSTWYMLSTTGVSRKQLYACEYDQLDIVIAGAIKFRNMYIQPTELVAGATGKDISSTVASRMVEYFSQAKDRVTWEVYNIPDFHDKKFDSMTYRKLTEYVISHYSPYVFSDKIVEGIRKNDPKYDMWTVLKEVA